MLTHFRRAALLLSAFAALAQADDDALSLNKVLDSVTSQHPQLTMALIERDIMAGRLRQAAGVFDLGLTLRGNSTPSGYYDGSSGDVLLDQPLPFWGGNVFAGYRISSGTLAEYDKARTQTEGELRAGLRINLLRDGPIDSRRATLWKARLDRELADPFIQRQQLDLVRAATRAYFNWLATGHRLSVAESLLRLAKDRNDGIAELVSKGQIAPIVKTDNDRLVVSRQLGVVAARRRFEQAGIELSLFHRNVEGTPVIIARHHLPQSFPAIIKLDDTKVAPSMTQALALRPELKRINLLAQKIGIDQRLARNGLLPHLDLTATISDNIGSEPYKDRKETEAAVGIELRIPLQRNEAKGRLEAANAELLRLDADAKFARERIIAEVQDAWSALRAAQDLIGHTKLNVELSEKMENAERELFGKGATDLLALQIREQATFDARQFEIDARGDFFRAQADYQAAVADLLAPQRLSRSQAGK